jgi:hypothetical protein
MRERKYGWADKAATYKQWRYDWDHGAVHDVDQVEWRDNKPLCVLELTSHGELHDDTKKSVAGRLWNSFSGRKLRHLAGRMNVPFFVVLFKIDMTALAVCHLTEEDASWYDLSPGQYRQWLCSLPHTPSAAVIADTLNNPQEFAR